MRPDHVLGVFQAVLSPEDNIWIDHHATRPDPNKQRKWRKSKITDLVSIVVAPFCCGDLYLLNMAEGALCPRRSAPLITSDATRIP